MLMESPLIQERLARRGHRYVIKYLTMKLGTVPPDIIERIERIVDEPKLEELVELSATCTDWTELRAQLPS